MRLLRTFWFLPAIILFVSVYDTWLTIRFEECMMQHEENPIGRWLIKIEGGDVGLFVRFKVAGTIFVMTVLGVMYRIRSRKYLPVTGSVAAYQAMLFVYLTFVG